MYEKCIIFTILFVLFSVPCSFVFASADTPSTTGAFVTTWETTAPNESVTIPVGGSSSIYTINWGDGTVNTNVSGNQTHQYAALGNHTVSISGNFSKIALGGDSTNAAKLRSIDQWGSTGWTSMDGAFGGASNMIYNATDSPDLLHVTNMSSMFEDAISFDGDLSGWNVSSVTDMSSMFLNADSFTGDLSGWDVSSVTDMSRMFMSADSFTGDLSGWNVSSVTDMSYMFWFATNFTSDLSEWDVSSVTDMSYMFEFVSKFTSDLSEWDVSRVTNMRSMFTGATVFTSDLSEWDVSRVTNMRFMLSGANSFNSDISNWNVSSATDMTGVISNNHAFVQNLGKWYVVLDDTTIDAMDLPRIVGHIAPQTTALTGSRPIYAIGTGGDSDSFRIIARNILWMYVAPDKALYSVNITYGGGSLGTNNHRVYDITVTSIDTDSAIAPTLASIERHSPADQNTDSQTLVYKVTFSEDVTGVNTGDFVLSQGSAGAGNTASMTGSGSVYYATVSATQDGTYNLDLVSSGHGIADTANNPLSSPTPTGADHTYTVSTTPADTTAPTVTSIVRSDPTDETTSAQTLVFAVTFSEDVTGVDAGDFELSGTGAGSITVSAVSGDTYNATVAVNTDGTFNLNIAGGHNIEDLAGTGLSSVTPTGADQSYTVDRTAPAVTSIVGNDPSGELTSESTLVFEVTFSEDVTGVDLSDFALSSGGTGTGSVTNLAGSGSQYLVTVSAAQDGTYNLDLVSSGHGITDAADNPLSSPTPTGADHTYAVDTTAPAVTSIVRSNPAEATTSERTLVFAVTFSEDVTGVDLSDFALSPGSTGGGSGSGQFTQTRSPALAITENNTVSNTITVPDSGTATSVSVAIDISHTWIGDLKVDLVAPDGTTQTLHNRTGGDADDIDQTYAPYFAGVPIAGAWTLWINDNYAAADDGTLDSWTLTINYGSSSTASPVTTVSGSGDTYHMTVSAAQDGTYNLDLVSSGHGITDAASNPLSSPTPTGADHTYTVSAVPADTTAPTVTSIVRSNPAGETTSAQTLVFAVTFSEDVTGVDLSDFALSSDGTGTGSVTNLAGSGSQYLVNVSAAQDGTYNLDLVSPGHGIADAANNTLSSPVPTGADHTYTVSTTPADTTAPTLASIERYSPADQNTDSQTLVYKVTFSESVTGVNTGDFVLSQGSAGAGSTANLTGSGSVYYATVSATQDGTYNLDLVSPGHGIADAANNTLSSPVPTGADHTYTVSTTPADTTAPTLASIERYSPAVENTDSRTLVYKVTFSEDVTGVDAADFALSSGSTGGTSTGSGQFTQTRSPALAIPYNQTVSDTITIPDSGTATSVSVAIDIEHDYIDDLKIDLIAPDGTTKTLHDHSGGHADDINQTYTPDFGSVPIAGDWILRMYDNYVDDSGILNSWTLTINHSSTATTTSPVTSGSGSVYYATVSAAQDGTYNLDLVSPGHGITDVADNPLSSPVPTGADHTYTVSTASADTTAPTVTSIVRSNPAGETTSAQTLVFAVTFSEDITGVDLSDFALSPDSTGGGSAPGQFTQTSEPATPIADRSTVQDAITVDRSGTATSVSVAVDISHTYIGDLVIDLIAPDGTSQTLHSRTGGSANDIDQTYAPDFDGTGIADDWTLRVSDRAGGDVGTLNSWTLTINHGAGTASPVTAVSGSGDTYQVTVSATTDGTYNLDLVPSGHGITDTPGNPLNDTSPTGEDQSYTVTILNVIPNSMPSVDAGSDQTVQENSAVTLSGTASDADDDPLTYLWFHDSDLTIALSDAASLSASFTAPQVDSDTTITFTLAAYDETSNATDTTSVTITDSTPPVVPDAPRSIGSVTLASTVPGVVEASWDAPAEEPGDYRIAWAKVGEGFRTWTDLTVNAFPTTTSHAITDLEEGAEYKVMVRARYDGGSGDWSDQYTVTVKARVQDTTDPTITLTGANLVSVTTGTAYSDPGATCTDDTDASPTLATTSTVDTLTAGTYQVTYTCTDSSSNMATVTRDVVVADAPDTTDPTITLTGANPVSVTTGTAYSDPGATCTDDTDASPTLATASSVDTLTAGTYQVTYTCTDSSSNTATATRDVVVADAPDTTDPTITLTGANPVSVTTGTAYSDPGATCTDDTDASPTLATTSTVDTLTAGTYQVTYTCTDSSSNTATATRDVVVADAPDTTAPTVSSIERHIPTDQNTGSQTLVYRVTFSENVTGVDLSDFALSPDSTGGGSSHGRFAQTSEPAIPIADRSTVQDAITVDQSGTATSVSVAVDISHTYIGDLVVDLIAPDGTTRTLHDRTGYETDDIDRTYTPDFGGAGIAGDWTLRVRDGAGGDTGTLNGWTLTVNHGGAGNPVTGLTGSGSQYLVNVYAAQNGTYNLDIVPNNGITDMAGNPLDGTGPTGGDQPYTVRTSTIRSYV